MKQKYTLTVANSQINIVTETPKSEIDSIVGIVDRRIREIHLHSRSCSRTDAAILLCLDYCAEKIELQKTIKSINSQLERLNVQNEMAQKEIASLEREIETLRASLNLSSTPKAKKISEEQIAIDDISNGESLEASAPKTPTTAVDMILAEEPEETVKPVVAVEEAPATTVDPEPEKLHAKARKKKVRAMFDMISFDDI